MIANPPPKPLFDEFVKTCTPLLKIPELEAQMREQTEFGTVEILPLNAKSPPKNPNIAAFMCRAI